MIIFFELFLFCTISFEEIIQHVKKKHSGMSNDAFVTNKEFDNLLAEARRFDGKSRRAQAEANGTLDVIAEAKKQMEAMTGNSSIQKVLGK